MSSALETDLIKNLGDTQVEHLVRQSMEAKARAHCPYSKFPVGAAILCEDGTIYLGCNIENAAYSLGLCAERTACAKAVSEGKKRFIAIALSSDVTEDFVSPCGACRQFLAEFGLDLVVYMAKPSFSVKKTTLRDLLPMAFTDSTLFSNTNNSSANSSNILQF